MVSLFLETYSLYSSISYFAELFYSFFYLHLVFNKFKTLFQFSHPLFTSQFLKHYILFPKIIGTFFSVYSSAPFLYVFVQFYIFTIFLKIKLEHLNIAPIQARRHICLLKRRKRFSVTAIHVMITMAGNNDAASKCMRKNTEAIPL